MVTTSSSKMAGDRRHTDDRLGLDQSAGCVMRVAQLTDFIFYEIFANRDRITRQGGEASELALLTNWLF